MLGSFYIAIFLLFFTNPLSADESIREKEEAGLVSPLFLGGGAYLKGMGAIYGGAVGLKNFVVDDVNIIAGASGGAVEAAGFLVSNIPFFYDKLRLSFGFADSRHYEFETSYARGLEENTVVRQEMQAKGSFLNYKWSVASGYLDIVGGYANTWSRFVNFKTLDGRVIPFSKGDLHDIETNTLRLGLIGHLMPSAPSNEVLDIHLGLLSLSGRLAQTDMDIYGFKVNGKHSLRGAFSIAYTAQIQRTATNQKGPTNFSVRGDCAAVADADMRGQCESLERDLSAFISASNEHGTALPIGGARGLRSFREFRFRAANTALSGLELRYDFRWIKPLQLAAFYEVGHADDDAGQLFKDSVSSYGLGLRVFVGKVPIRFEVASGEGEQAAFLTLGSPW